MILIRFRVHCCTKSPSPCLAHPYSHAVYAIYPDEVAIAIHCLFRRRFPPSPGDLSYVGIDIPDLLDISRRRLRRAAGHTGRMDPTLYQTHSRSYIVERRGPPDPAIERRGHERVRRLGLVASSEGRWEAENSYLRADHRPTNQRSIVLSAS